MKKKLRKTLVMMFAMVMLISGTLFWPGVDTKAADTLSFIVKVSSDKIKNGDTIHVELWVEGATDLISFVGNVNLDPNVYTVDQSSLQFGELYNLSSQIGGMPQIVSNDDQSYSVMLDFMGPVETTGMVFSFDAMVNEDASESGAIVFEYIGSERGTADSDRHEVPNTDIITLTTDMEGNVIEEGSIPVINESESIPLKKIAFREKITPLEVGQTVQLEIVFDPENTTVDRNIIWNSSDSSIASIKDGVVHALKVGTTMINAKVGDKEASYELTVTEPQSMLNPSNPSGVTSGDQDSESDEQEKNQANGGQVETGDTSNIYIILVLLVTSLSVIVLKLRKSVKKNFTDKN